MEPILWTYGGLSLAVYIYQPNLHAAAALSHALQLVLVAVAWALSEVTETPVIWVHALLVTVASLGVLQLQCTLHGKLSVGVLGAVVISLSVAACIQGPFLHSLPLAFLASLVYLIDLLFLPGMTIPIF